jgi:hypothetical protein
MEPSLSSSHSSSCDSQLPSLRSQGGQLPGADAHTWPGPQSLSSAHSPLARAAPERPRPSTAKKRAM